MFTEFHRFFIYFHLFSHLFSSILVRSRVYSKAQWAQEAPRKRTRRRWSPCSPKRCGRSRPGAQTLRRDDMTHCIRYILFKYVMLLYVYVYVYVYVIICIYMLYVICCVMLCYVDDLDLRKIQVAWDHIEAHRR